MRQQFHVCVKGCSSWRKQVLGLLGIICLAASPIPLLGSVPVLGDGDGTAAEESPQPSVAVRFTDAESSHEVPDFQRHVTPLLGKLGCNGRACHGSFQGRGGFRLSLFGYDFKSDHDEMFGRIDPETPTESLVLQKPLMQIPHEGGRRLNEGSWEHHLLLSWIQKGAPARTETPAQLTRLEVTPREIQFSGDDQNAQLKAVAVWSDGSREDVTTLCRFQSNDDQVADINAEGLVASGAPGDTHVVVFYDSAVIPIPVLRPVSDRFGENYPETPTPTKVDELIVEKLRKIGVVQSELCSDEEFLRRASLDTTGTLPTPAEVRAFVADTSSDKRSRKIDELLERPGYVAWWTTQLCDFTGNSDDQLNNVTPVRQHASRQWYEWIFKRVKENVSYDNIVEGIVMAVSREPGESYQDYCENLSKLNRPDPEGSYADRSYLPHYWSRTNFSKSEDRVIGFAYTFLGSRIQCAQCHKHPFDQWTQEDFQKFEGFFKGTQGNARAPHAGIRKEYNEMVANLDGTDGLKGNQLTNQFAKLLKEGATVPFGEVIAVPVAGNANRGKVKGNKKDEKRPLAGPTAKLLGGAEIVLTEYQDIREPLMAWLRSPDNPLFAKAFVNRVWASYFNRGIVHPSDDLNLANPPSNAALLDYLAKGFIENDFDMKWVHRTILNSRTYQLSWAPNETNRLDEKNFARAMPRRLPAEVVWDMMAQAVTSTDLNHAMVTNLESRAVSIPGAGIRRNQNSPANYALTVFGRSIRESNCDCDRSSEPSLLQTIFVRNDDQLMAMINNRNGWLAEVAKKYDQSFSASGNDSQRQADERRRELARQRYQDRIKALRKSLEVAKASGNDKNIARFQSQIKALKAQATSAGILASEGEATETAPTEVVKSSSSGKLPEGWDSAELISEAYLRTLSRLPETSELETAEQFINDADNPIDGLRSVLWALLNTKEFIVNH